MTCAIRVQQRNLQYDDLWRLAFQEERHFVVKGQKFLPSKSVKRQTNFNPMKIKLNEE